MKCKHCDHRYPLTSGGMGWSSPPGHFFFAGHALVVNAGVICASAFAIGLDNMSGILAYVMSGVLIAGAFLAFFLSATVALADQHRYGSWPTCPECEHEQVPRPWSI